MRLSVLIPVRNGERFIEPAIRSALAQRVEDCEIVVWDNASTDRTADIARGFRDPRIRYVRQPRDVGMEGNFRAALAGSRADYVSFLSADDCLLDGALAALTRCLEDDRRLVFAFGAVRIINEPGEVIGHYDPRLPEVMAGREFVRSSLRRLENVVYLPSAVARRTAVLAAGGIRDDGMAFDYSMWLRTALQGAVRYLPREVAAYRQHSANESRRYEQPSRKCEAICQAFAWAVAGPDPELSRLASEAQVRARGVFAREVLWGRMRGALRGGEAVREAWHFLRVLPGALRVRRMPYLVAALLPRAWLLAIRSARRRIVGLER